MSIPQPLVEFFKANEWLGWKPPEGDLGHQRMLDYFEANDGATDALFEWIRNQSQLTSLKLPISIPHEEMYQEGLRLYPHAVAHRGSSHEGWKSIAIHGIEYDKTNDANKYGYEDTTKAPYRWTVASAAAPVATEWFKSVFPFQHYMRVRFMYLEPGGYILPHDDSPVPGMGAINIALNNPPGCDMVIEGKGRIPWSPGDVRFLDVSNTHAVWNRSDTLRIHMIAHALDWGDRANDFRQAVIKGYMIHAGVIAV